MRKLNHLIPFIIIGILSISTTALSQYYIDVTVRLDDYWAKVTETGGGEPTWHSYFKIGSSIGSSSTSSTKHVWHASPGGAYAFGKDYNQSFYYFPSIKVLNNADNIYFYLEGWEEDSPWNYSVYQNEDDYHSGPEYETNTNISANTQNSYVNLCGGTVEIGGRYKVETSVKWNYSIPSVNCSLDNETYSTLDINMTPSTYYIVDSWYYQVSEVSSFVPTVTTGTISDGSSTTTVTGLDPNTTYYVRIRGTNDGGTGSYSATTNTTTGSDQTTWNGSAWSNGAPDSGMDITFSGNYNLSVPIDCDDMTINSGVQLSLVASNAVVVNGDLLNNGTLSMAGSGSLITYGTITNNGTTTISHEMTDGEWHFVSPPISDATANVFMGDYLQYYNESLALDNYIDISDETTSLNVCQGYGWRNYSKGSFTFTGELNTGNQSIATTADQAYGWNLVGNPYPSSLDWNLLDGTYGTIYIWTGAATLYSTYNDGASTNGGTRYIAPMQGFFISTSSAGTFSVNNTHRTSNGSDGFVKSKEEMHNYLKLYTLKDNHQDELVIQFGGQYIAGFDQLHDAWKMMSNNLESAQLYSKTSDGNLCIDRRPESEQIPLGFKMGINAPVSIGLSESADMDNIILEDRKLQIFHELKNGSYNFNWETNDTEDRFILHLKATGIDDLASSGTKIFAYQRTITIRSSEKLNNAQISIIDMMGRVVYESRLVDGQNEQITAPVKDGVYMIQLISDEGTQVEKVILR